MPRKEQSGTLVALIVIALAFVSHASTVTEPSRSVSSLYNKNCVSCHGRDGRSRTSKAKRNHARDIADSSWHEAVSDERIYNSISNGRGKMPKFSRKLSEAEIDALVSYVRALKK